MARPWLARQGQQAGAARLALAGTLVARFSVLGSSALNSALTLGGHAGSRRRHPPARAAGQGVSSLEHRKLSSLHSCGEQGRVSKLPQAQPRLLNWCAASRRRHRPPRADAAPNNLCCLRAGRRRCLRPARSGWLSAAPVVLCRYQSSGAAWRARRAGWPCAPPSLSSPWNAYTSGPGMVMPAMAILMSRLQR